MEPVVVNVGERQVMHRCDMINPLAAMKKIVPMPGVFWSK